MRIIDSFFTSQFWHRIIFLGSIKIFAIIFLAISTLGFFDATYLTIEHYQGAVPFCSIRGCEIVLASAQGKVAGIPVALFGSLYYLTLFVLSVAYLDNKKKSLIKLASRLTPLGLIASLYFVYLQFFVIKQICQYCMVSAGTSILLFIMGMCILAKMHHTRLNP